MTPNIMKSQTDLPQVIVITALFAGGAVGGILGVLVAVPLAGAGMVLVEHLVSPAIRRWTAARLRTHDPELVRPD